MYPYDYLIYNDFLMHHGILGQKWGIRRFQNEDGSLTAEGQARYRTHSIKGNVGRAVFNTSLGQRLLGVGANKGYKADKKEIKALYKAEKEKIKNKDIDDEEKKKELKSLKKDYEETKGEARVSAAEALYPWQSKSANEKIQTQALGKQWLKGYLMGGYGTLNYDRLTADGDNSVGEKIGSAALGTISGAADYATRGAIGIGDYTYNKLSYEKKNKANGTYSKGNDDLDSYIKK